MLRNLLELPGAKPLPDPVLSPPGPEPGGCAMGGGILLGRAQRWNPELLPNAHLVCVGASGSGKTQTLKAIAHALRGAYPGRARVIVIDFHGDQEIGGEDCYALHRASPHGINPLRVIDEAKQMPAVPGSACDRIIAEGRKYGLALLLASQSERHLSREVISNSATEIVLPVDQTEARKVAIKFPFAEARLAALRPLTALCRFGLAAARVEIWPYYERATEG